MICETVLVIALAKKKIVSSLRENMGKVGRAAGAWWYDVQET